MLVGWFIFGALYGQDGRTEIFQGSRQYVDWGTGALPPSSVARRKVM
jgi:hypothetical protein